MAELIEKPIKIADEHFLLKIKCNSTGSEAGQFINLKASNNTDPLIRRPFSIYNHNDNIIEVVIRVIGKGTKLISEFDIGEIDMLGPLGKSFTIKKEQNLLLIGGGVGNAPLYYLGKKLKNYNNKLTYIYGSRSKNFIYQKNEFAGLFDEVHFVTDDGSEGEKGFVTDIAEKILSNENFDMIYTCGPTIMMKKVSELSNNIPVEVSVENYFGCGIGLCVGCTIETDGQQKRACIDGPVFNGKSINWERLLDMDCP